MAGFSDWLFGSPDRLEKFDTSTKEQQALHNSILSQAMGMNQKGGGYQNAQNYYNNLIGENQQQAYNQFASPYLQNFEEQILPMIAERFAGAGALSSSGFGQAVGGAGAGLQAQLAQLFSQLQSQAAGAQTQQYNQLSQSALNYQPFGYQKTQGSGGFLPTLLGGIGTAVAGPVGSAIGEVAGKGISNLFKPSQNGGIT